MRVKLSLIQGFQSLQFGCSHHKFFDDISGGSSSGEEVLPSLSDTLVSMTTLGVPSFFFLAVTFQIFLPLRNKNNFI